MKKITNHLAILILLCLICSAKITQAQSPCSVTLTTMLSSGGNVSFYANTSNSNSVTPSPFVWNYGNGSSMSGNNMFNAATIYTANGTYTVSVTYTSAIAGCTATASQTINVSNANGCGLVPQFYQAVGSNGLANFTSYSQNTVQGTTYIWEFGDGSTNGSGSAVTHTYVTTSTNYVVKLTVNNNSIPSCIDSTASNLYACGPPPTVTSTTSANGAVTFSASMASGSTSSNFWNFGNGVNGGGSNPTHTYLANGNYTVTYTGGVGQCSATVLHTLNVGNVTAPCGLIANFYGLHSSNGLVNFVNYTSGASSGVSYLWNFGNGGAATSNAPAHTYAANGTYVVTLVANNNYTYSCISTTTMAIIVTSYCNLTAGFSAAIGANGSVSFANTTTGTTTGPTSYTWNFGNGSSSNLTSPARTYANGVYTVVLSATKSNSLTPGCTNSLSQVITVTTCIANASFSMTPTGTPQFWNAYPLVPGNVTAASWNWGDNSSSDTLYTTHTYSAAGTYSICLSVTVSCGSTNTFCAPYAIYKSSETNENIDMIQVTVKDPATVGIKNVAFEKLDFTISPNPNNGHFNLNIKELNATNVHVSIYNLVGKLVYQTEAEVNGGRLVKEIRLEEFSGGVYFIKLNAGNKLFTTKLIVNKQ